MNLATINGHVFGNTLQKYILINLAEALLKCWRHAECSLADVRTLSIFPHSTCTDTLMKLVRQHGWAIWLVRSISDVESERPVSAMFQTKQQKFGRFKPSPSLWVFENQARKEMTLFQLFQLFHKSWWRPGSTCNSLENSISPLVFSLFFEGPADESMDLYGYLWIFLLLKTRCNFMKKRTIVFTFCAIWLHGQEQTQRYSEPYFIRSPSDNCKLEPCPDLDDGSTGNIKSSEALTIWTFIQPLIRKRRGMARLRGSTYQLITWKTPGAALGCGRPLQRRSARTELSRL